MFSDHNELNISKRKISGKFPNVYKLNGTLLNNPQKKKIKRKISKYFKINEDRNTID